MSDVSYDPAVKILLPVIRKVMPAIIASDIIGSQNMTGASGFYAPYVPVTMVSNQMIGTASLPVLTKAVTQAHYRHFLRINNRKRHWSENDLHRAGYPEATVVGHPVNPPEHPFLSRQWCLENIDEGRFVRFGYRYFFANAEDHLMFVMMWGSA